MGIAKLSILSQVGEDMGLAIRLTGVGHDRKIMLTLGV